MSAIEMLDYFAGILWASCEVGDRVSTRFGDGILKEISPQGLATIRLDDKTAVQVALRDVSPAHGQLKQLTLL